jgi:hypothetical protein
MLAAQGVEEGVLEELAFVIAHDILRVQKSEVESTTLPQPSCDVDQRAK